MNNLNEEMSFGCYQKRFKPKTFLTYVSEDRHDGFHHLKSKFGSRPAHNIYIFWCLESESDAAVETGGFLLLADEFRVAVKIDTFLLLESAFNLK